MGRGVPDLEPSVDGGRPPSSNSQKCPLVSPRGTNPPWLVEYRRMPASPVALVGQTWGTESKGVQRETGFAHGLERIRIYGLAQPARLLQACRAVGVPCRQPGPRRCLGKAGEVEAPRGAFPRKEGRRDMVEKSRAALTEGRPYRRPLAASRPCAVTSLGDPPPLRPRTPLTASEAREGEPIAPTTRAPGVAFPPSPRFEV